MALKSTYRILRFSPVPEFLAPVNVALVINDGALRVHYDKDFRRLRCVVPDFNTASLSYMLDYLGSHTARADDEFITDYIAGQSAQFELTAPRPLETSQGKNVITVLTENYLRQLKDHVAILPERDRGYIESTLNQFILMSAVVSKDIIRKRAKPSSFLRSARARNLFHGTDLVIKRVVDGAHGIVLIDGIDLTTESIAHLGNRTASIAHAYYMFGKHRKELEDAEQRRLRKASIVFNIDARRTNSHRDYFVSQLERESDLLVCPDDATSVSSLKSMCSAAVGN
ncbi:MAG: hypothetical protein C0404_11895 [Verrucomicrobia bacterium]|nr:hypothetical protein [Verrucomicrobiota bacterium]